MKLNKDKVVTLVRKTGGFAHFLSAATRFLLVILVLCVIYSSFTQKEIADNIVRLHIIANSDTAADQALKLKVRDAVIHHMQEKYPNGATKEEAARYLKDSLPEIEQLAVDILKANGSQETVRAQYGVFPFPTKEYENVTLPAGMYEAVRIELGKAEGQNWWCVMFPPLCIADGNILKMSEQSERQLRASLGENNFSLITDITDSKNTPVKVKFRIIELIESSKIKLSELISSLF